MTHKQIEAVVMLKEAIRKFEGCESVYLAIEDAKVLKELIDSQAEYIKELLEQIDELKLKNNDINNALLTTGLLGIVL